MKPLSSYHLKDGVYVLKNMWLRRVKTLAMIAFTIVATTYPSVEGHTTEIGHTYNKSVHIDQVVTTADIPRKDAQQIVQSVYKWSNEFEVDKKLVLAIAKVESGFNKYAISPSGAYGLMQVIPVWHKEKIVEAKKRLGNPEIFNIDTNIFLGTWVLKDCLTKFNKVVNKALLCYSGQTKGYDQKVMQEYAKI